ncbi:MAG TPA: nitroreductase family protein, partial [Bradyrhizobium sp.]|nr:nitroreductase family protein [Bradyrhizobium sp.]
SSSDQRRRRPVSTTSSRSTRALRLSLSIRTVLNNTPHSARRPSPDGYLYASVDAGFIGQNVYLFCASEGLATVFWGAVDTAKLGKALKLPEQQFVTFGRSVGYPRA